MPFDQRRQRGPGLEETGISHRHEGCAIDAEDAALRGEAPHLILRGGYEGAAARASGGDLAGCEFQNRLR
jgi:hypothetical protein